MSGIHSEYELIREMLDPYGKTMAEHKIATSNDLDEILVKAGQVYQIGDTISIKQYDYRLGENGEKIDLHLEKVMDYDPYSSKTAPAKPKPECLEVMTSAGVIRAYKSTDPGQPGISVMFQPAGFTEEIDLSFISVYEDPEYRTKDGERPEDVCIMTYADVSQEDYTYKDIIRREDVLKSLGE